MIEKPRTPEATLDLCGAILDQARAYLGHGKPRDWRAGKITWWDRTGRH